MDAPRSFPLPTFEELARRADDEIDVALGAAPIAEDVYDRLDVPALLARVDALAGALDGSALAGLPALRQAEAVSDRFRHLGFRGNVEDYYDPRNILLPDVLKRKTGIPITLTLVWLEIAKRAGVRASGVSFPGHFIARVDAPPSAMSSAPPGQGPPAPVLVDPFGGGRVVDETDAKMLLRRALGDGAQLYPSLFAGASSRDLLVRLLTNLKAIWANRGDHTRAFVAIDRIVTLIPSSGRMLRERAAVALRLGIDDLARADLLRVLELEPQAPDVPHIEKRLRELGSRSEDQKKAKRTRENTPN